MMKDEGKGIHKKKFIVLESLHHHPGGLLYLYSPIFPVYFTRGRSDGLTLMESSLISVNDCE